LTFLAVESRFDSSPSKTWCTFPDENQRLAGRLSRSELLRKTAASVKRPRQMATKPSAPESRRIARRNRIKDRTPEIMGQVTVNLIFSRPVSFRAPTTTVRAFS
jgi:hypothetical protein